MTTYFFTASKLCSADFRVSVELEGARKEDELIIWDSPFLSEAQMHDLGEFICFQGITAIDLDYGLAALLSDAPYESELYQGICERVELLNPKTVKIRPPFNLNRLPKAIISQIFPDSQPPFNPLQPAITQELTHEEMIDKLAFTQGIWMNEYRI